MMGHGQVEMSVLDLREWERPADLVDRAVLWGIRGPVLEVGCGPGRLVAALAESGTPALGIDISPLAAELACTPRRALARTLDLRSRSGRGAVAERGPARREHRHRWQPHDAATPGPPGTRPPRRGSRGAPRAWMSACAGKYPHRERSGNLRNDSVGHARYRRPRSCDRKGGIRARGSASNGSEVVQLAAQRIAQLRTGPRVAFGVWIQVIAVGAAIGVILNARGRNIVLPVPPILARFGPGCVRVCCCQLPWRESSSSHSPVSKGCGGARLLAVVPLASSGWTLALALSEGTSGLTRGPSSRTDYLADVPTVVADPGSFLRHFTTDIQRYEIHVRGHPPGMVLLLAGLDRLGLGGAGWEAAIVVALASTAPIAVLLVVREVAGESMARRSMPWLVLTPAAIWIATSADALYMAVGAWSVALVVLASIASWTARCVDGARRRSPRRPRPPRLVRAHPAGNGACTGAVDALPRSSAPGPHHCSDSCRGSRSARCVRTTGLLVARWLARHEARIRRARHRPSVLGVSVHQCRGVVARPRPGDLHRSGAAARPRAWSPRRRRRCRGCAC